LVLAKPAAAALAPPLTSPAAVAETAEADAVAGDEDDDSPEFEFEFKVEFESDGKSRKDIPALSRRSNTEGVSKNAAAGVNTPPAGREDLSSRTH
jgi:hypothetical protein